MSVRLTVVIALLLASNAVVAEPLWDVPERRKEQFPTEYAYLLAPLPYSMPGIGEGYFLMGYLSNLFETTADVAAVSVQGDATGLVSQLDEVPLIKDRLFLQVIDLDISKATVSDYESRGMDSGSDYNLVEVSGVRQQSAELTLSFWQRRLAFTTTYKSSASDVDAIRDSSGNLISSTNPPPTENISRNIGTMLDLTDDYQDPRDGLRLRLDVTDHPRDKSSDPDFFVIDYSLLYYQPFNGTDTLVFNFFRSDAHLRSQGETNPSVLIAEWGGSSCGVGETACIDAETQRLNNAITANRYGTATSLGGTDRLRSYADGRFSGAHTEFLGVEFRSNFVQDAEPFDYLIWKDVRTSVQLAVFAEVGTVAETRDDLWKETRSSVGIGARLVTASGSVYRADWATGDEGSEFSVFFFYPWK